MATILTEVEAVPFKAVLNALRCMRYASKERVMFEMLVLTGCRLQALDNMRTGMLIDGVVFYHPGKNQKGYIKNELPIWYLKELSEYRKYARCWGDHLFSCSADSFRRYFVSVRQNLTPEWRERVLMPKHGALEDCYRLQLKGLRKLYFTNEYRRLYALWKDSGVALAMTSASARHSSTRMTCAHYIRDFKQLGGLNTDIPTALKNDGQRVLPEY